MDFVSSPTEQTTAVTNLFLTAQALFALHTLGRIPSVGQRWKQRLWMVAFVLLALAGLLGAFAHGMQISSETYQRIWYVLNLVLLSLVSLFGVAATCDVWGQYHARRVLPVMMVVGLLLYASLYIGEGGQFLWVVAYQGCVMLLALLGYGWVAWRGRLPGGWLMVMGILLSITAAALQATPGASLQLVWQFDNNGIYHLVQMLSVVALMTGVGRALRSRS